MTDVKRKGHNLRISPMGSKSLFIEWDGFQGRHDYFMVQDVQDLNVLISELDMAKNNFVRKKIIKV